MKISFVRLDKRTQTAGASPDLEDGKWLSKRKCYPAHQESSFELVEATIWVKRKQSKQQAVISDWASINLSFLADDSLKELEIYNF